MITEFKLLSHDYLSLNMNCNYPTKSKFDFYDSDGKRKSVFGTAMKTAAQIVPMFMAPAVKYT